MPVVHSIEVANPNKAEVSKVVGSHILYCNHDRFAKVVALFLVYQTVELPTLRMNPNVAEGYTEYPALDQAPA
jgi:hypothetical protein